MLQEELRRAFLSANFCIAILIGVIALAIGLYNYSSFLLANPGYISQVPRFFYNAYDAFIASLDVYALVAPVIAVLPFADSLVRDVNSGYTRSILLRASYGQYSAAKLISCALSGGLSVVIPLIILFVCTNVLFPRGINLDPYNRRFDIDAGGLGAFGYMYKQQPDLYIWMRMLLCFLFGAAYALLGVSISTLTDNRYIVLASPVLLYFVVNFTIALLGIPRWLPSNAIAPTTVNGVTSTPVFTGLGTTISIALILFLAMASRIRLRI